MVLDEVWGIAARLNGKPFDVCCTRPSWDREAVIGASRFQRLLAFGARRFRSIGDHRPPGIRGDPWKLTDPNWLRSRDHATFAPMNIALPKLLTVDEFLAWSQTQPKEAGKFELLDGVVIVQQSPKWIHTKLKHRVFAALAAAIERAGVSCFAAPEGPSVRINARKCFEPDALVAALPEPADDSQEVANAIIVVEVLLPSTAHVDTSAKLKGYFEVPSIQHYLIVDPSGATITHYRRMTGDVLETRILSDGALTLSPPGIEIDVKRVFG
jgi:Uma2 family endonuclease